MNKSKFNQSEVARITGKSRTTIQKDLTKGKLSFELDDNNNKIIQASELIRAYGEQTCNFEALDGVAVEKKKGKEGGNSHEMISVSLFNQITKELKEQYQARIDSLENALEKSQKITLLLEGPKRDNKDEVTEARKKSISLLEDQLSDKTTLYENELNRSRALHQKNKKLEAKIELLKSEIEQLKNKRVFGFKVFDSANSKHLQNAS